jgi:DNA-binding LacI/PurR family transcriptional regulator
VSTPRKAKASRAQGESWGATISDVAKHAGVSQSTVSYVLSGNRSISEQTRARVFQSIQKLDFTPHAGARSLRAGKTDVMALVVPFYDWATWPSVMSFVYGVVDAARLRGWNVILLTGAGGVSEIDSVVKSKLVDRVALMEVRIDDERLKLVERLGIPAVSVGLPSMPVKVPYVDFDFESAGRLCVEHLVNVGHRHVGLLASPPGAFEKNLAYAHALFRGVATAMEDAGLAFHGRPMEATIEGIERALDALFEEQPLLTALIVHNEGMIDLVMHALHQRGKRVPAQISVITVEVRELTRHAVKSLTHVTVPAVEMGRTAVRLLAEGGPGILLPATLVPGSTVAHPFETQVPVRASDRKRSAGRKPTVKTQRAIDRESPSGTKAASQDGGRPAARRVVHDLQKGV